MMYKNHRKNRYFIELAYRGTTYHGWQIQPNANSIQAELQKGFSLLLGEKIQIIGAGRTDTGVHASYFVAHMDVSNSFDCAKILFKINCFLPKDIVVYSIVPVCNEAHARFSAVKRTYNYIISQEKNPFRLDTAYVFTRKLDVEAMQMASNILFEYIDFTSFSRLHTDVKTNNCKIQQAEWKQERDLLVFTVAADRFLRNMVRAIVGTLIEVGLHKRQPDEMAELIEAKDRSAAGASAPACGLFLAQIEYPEHLFLPLEQTRGLWV